MEIEYLLCLSGSSEESVGRFPEFADAQIDHEVDPNEWDNIVGDERFAEVIASHRRWLPTKEAGQVPDLSCKPPR